ncbi:MULTISPECIES: biotin--[acetyl-CoA-carboxylase] ligase [unclassified Haladaptatus]|uniref:biotin--[acetyl-CoA-carboxylase] ligase n=1 Tax=unclassified Haladaptatus TaxID=2622732 RepID=UPI0023E83A35|nr:MULTISPECIES: biotin--[acetyl-CoA-carboxylase] ligase [unclassified Haladaptatus]
MNETRARVLAALAAGPVSGPELAASLDISRAAVWKHVEGLRDAGFTIESGDEGYIIADVPEYGGPAVEYGLEAPYTIEYHDSIDSTNRRARDLAKDGAENVVVLSDEQVGGRGRLNREWVAPAGGIWMSVVIRPDLPAAHAPLLTLGAAVAVTRAAREAGVEAVIKWPNDVLVTTDDGEKKLCGILTEMSGEADRVSWVVVGIGVNANLTRDQIPETGTSLLVERGEVNRRVFVQRVLEEFHDLVSESDDILSAWREYAHTLGQRVRVETPNGDVVGKAVDVEFPGTLCIETDEGLVRVSSGDCDHLRPV